MLEKNIKDLEVKWLNEEDWKRMRDFLILKLQDCDTEEKFNFILEALIGSMFKNPEELDKYRKDFQKQQLTKREKSKFNKIIKS